MVVIPLRGTMVLRVSTEHDLKNIPRLHVRIRSMYMSELKIRRTRDGFVLRGFILRSYLSQK